MAVIKGKGHGGWPWQDMMTIGPYHAHSETQHTAVCVCGLWCSFHFKRTLVLMVMVSQRFPSLFPVQSHRLAAEEHSPLGKQTMDIFHRQDRQRVNMAMSQAISGILCSFCPSLSNECWLSLKIRHYALMAQKEMFTENSGWSRGGWMKEMLF